MSHPCLEPADSAVADIIALGNVNQWLTGLASCHGFLALVKRQLGLPAHLHAAGFRALVGQRPSALGSLHCSLAFFAG